MNKWKYYLIPCAAIVALIALILQLFEVPEADAQTTTQSNAPQPIPCVVNPTVVVPNLTRLGMNMSFRSPYAAEQYIKNVLMNPGFEGVVERIAVIVNNPDNQGFSDNQKGLGQPDGFWTGCDYEVRSGQHAGYRGVISNSLNESTDGLPRYFTEGTAPTLSKNDVVVITKTSEPAIPTLWSPSNNSAVHVDCGNTRPGSTGTCSAVIDPNTELNFYLDTEQGEAGNLLNVKGDWNFSVWVKGEGKGGNLRVKFARLNSTPPYFEQTFPLTNDWQQVSYKFTADANALPGGIKFSFNNDNAQEKIWVDDVELGPAQASNPQIAWMQDVVDMLKQIKPSYLRDWQLQSADTTKNRIADQFARKCSGFRYAGGPPSMQYSYSIPDLLELCKQVGANPWIIIPTALEDAELDEIGLFLGQHADTSKFSDVIIEIGDENWNFLFRSEQLPIIEALGPVADRAFQRIEASAGSNVHLTKVIGGQARNHGLTIQYATGISSLSKISVAGYFFDGINAGSTQQTVIDEMFAHQTDYLKQLIQDKPSNLGINIYEMNLGTSLGSAGTAERVPYTAGAISGTAMAQALIDTLQFNPNPNMIFCFAQYNSKLWETQGTVKIWGICRDCSTTKRWRPTGLAVIMLNQVIGGSLHTMTPTPPQGGSLPPEANKLTLAAFRTGDSWNAAITSANPNPVDIVVQFPDDNLQLPTTLNVMKYANSYLDTNEEAENVKIVSQPIEANQRNISVTIPAYGFVTLSGQASPSTQASTEMPQSSSTDMTPATSTTTTNIPATSTTTTTTSTTTPSIKPASKQVPKKRALRKRKATSFLTAFEDEMDDHDEEAGE